MLKTIKNTDYIYYYSDEGFFLTRDDDMGSFYTSIILPISSFTQVTETNIKYPIYPPVVEENVEQ